MSPRFACQGFGMALMIASSFGATSTGAFRRLATGSKPYCTTSTPRQLVCSLARYLGETWLNLAFLIFLNFLGHQHRCWYLNCALYKMCGVAWFHYASLSTSKHISTAQADSIEMRCMNPKMCEAERSWKVALVNSCQAALFDVRSWWGFDLFRQSGMSHRYREAMDTYTSCDINIRQSS